MVALRRSPSACVGSPLDGKRTETAAWIRDLAIQREPFQAETDERPAWQASDRDAILQPPKPEIIPSARILQLAAEPDYEAAD